MDNNVLKQVIFIGENTGKGNHAGNKARKDINDICEELFGSPYVSYRQRSFHSFTEKIVYVLAPAHLIDFFRMFCLRDRIIVMQYPFYCNPLLKKLFYKIINLNKIVLLIHDVDALRNFGDITMDEEISLFNQCDCLIVHNEKMLMALNKLGVTSKMISLNVFDYLRKTTTCPGRSFSSQIAFAGNLSKSTFLNKLGLLTDLSFNLYGPNFNGEKIKTSNIQYCGSYSPDIIPCKLEGSFGLIWDGNSIETCTGSFGNYIRYNNPHKLSLYISSGLPVIAWSQAAIADFIKQNNIGFCVENLKDIPKRLSTLTKNDYDKYHENIKNIQDDVIHGVYTKNALCKAITNIVRA